MDVRVGLWRKLSTEELMLLKCGVGKDAWESLRLHFMANIWGNSGWLYFLGSKITADGDCSHEIKRRLLLGRKVMTNPDSILKSRDITLPTKVRLVKAMISQWSCMDVRVGLWRRLSTEELMLLKCGVGEDSWESLGLQGDPTSPFWRRSALGFLWKECC